jgi:hypothetical protein
LPHGSGAFFRISAKGYAGACAPIFHMLEHVWSLLSGARRRDLTWRDDKSVPRPALALGVADPGLESHVEGP